MFVSFSQVIPSASNSAWKHWVLTRLEEKPAKPVAGRFVPQCAADGSYEEVQCYGSTGYCWCVDVEGNPVLGTMTRGMPHCNKTSLGGENYMIVYLKVQFKVNIFIKVSNIIDKRRKWFKIGQIVQFQNMSIAPPQKVNGNSTGGWGGWWW